MYIHTAWNSSITLTCISYLIIFIAEPEGKASNLDMQQKTDILLCVLKIAQSVSRSSIRVCSDHSSRAIALHMHSRLSRPLNEASSALLCML